LSQDALNSIALLKGGVCMHVRIIVVVRLNLSLQWYFNIKCLDTDWISTHLTRQHALIFVESSMQARLPTSDKGNDNSDDYRFSQLPDADDTPKSPGKFTISAALQKNKSSISSVSNATDIVAVVLSPPNRQEAQPITSNTKTIRKGNINSTRINLLIGDHSLLNGQCARFSVSVSASSDASLAILMGVDGGGKQHSVGNKNSTINHDDEYVSIKRFGQLQPGDVVRFNRLEIRTDYQTESPNLGNNDKKRKRVDNSIEKTTSDKDSQGLLNIICDLAPSWRELSVGPSVARLCRIYPKNDGLQSTTGYDMEWENNLPSGMETKKELVDEIASWYCTFATSQFAKPTAMIPTNQSCQRRKLRDIATPNMLSNIVVKVLRCEKAVSAAAYTTPSKTLQSDAVLTHVTLSDGKGSDDILGLGGTVSHGRVSSAISSIPKSISSVLLQSMNEGSTVLLTHIESQQASIGSSSLLLVPTRETTATILTPDHPYFVNDDKPTTRDDENFASQPLTMEVASQFYQMTQQHSPPIMMKGTSSSKPTSVHRGMLVVVAPLIDIIVDGIDTSFMEGSYSQSPQALSKFLIDAPSISTGMKSMNLKPAYRSATLILDPKAVARDINVNADGNTMKLLCLDVPVEDMLIINNDDTDTSNPYLHHVGDLLKALCNDKTPIRWVLEQESEYSWFVSSAHLVEL